MLLGLANTIPFPVLIIMFMLLFMLIAYLSALISSYFVPHLNLQENRKAVDSSLRLLATGYLFLMVFIIVNTWNYQEEARKAISTEANFLSTIVRAIKIFPPQDEQKIRQALNNYVVDVRVYEWEAMRKGKESPLSREHVEALHSAIQAYQPKTYQEKLYHNIIANNMDDLLQARRDRLSKVESIIPNSLMSIFFWFSIFLTVILGIIRGRDTLSLLSPMLIFAALLGFDMAIAVDFDYPYAGNSKVTNKAFYQGVLATIPDT